MVFTPSYCFTIVCVLVCQSCLTLCDSKDCNQPGVSLHGILQARILGRVAIPFSRHLPDPRMELKSPILQASFLASELPGKILFFNYIYITYKMYLISSFLEKKKNWSVVVSDINIHQLFFTFSSQNKALQSTEWSFCTRQ